MIRALLVSLALAAPATAQDLAFDPALVEACHGSAEGLRPACIGNAAALCQERTDGGFTTAGMAGCTARETREWDRLLNAEYAETLRRLKTLDTGTGIDRSDALRDAQRAWIAFRDAECRLQYAMWQEGTIRALIGSSCHLDFTATRTLELRALRQEADL